MQKLLPPPSLLRVTLTHSLRINKPYLLLPLVSIRTYASLNEKTDQRDPDLPPPPPAIPTIEKTPDFQVPWLLNGPRLDMSKYKFPLSSHDGKETVKNMLLQIPLVENTVRYLLHSLTRFLIVKMTNLLTYPNYLISGFFPGAQHAATLLFKALSEKDHHTLNEICTPQLYERLQQSLDRLDSEHSEAKLSVEKVFGMKLNDIWLKFGHPQMFLARPSRNLTVRRTMTITIGKMKADEPVEDEKPDALSFPGILHELSVDVQFIAHVTRSLSCLPANADNLKIKNEPISVLDDKGPREFTLSFKSSPVPRRVGTGGNDHEEGYRTATELKWKISDIDYLLASEGKSDVTMS